MCNSLQLISDWSSYKESLIHSQNPHTLVLKSSGLPWFCTGLYCYIIHLHFNFDDPFSIHSWLLFFLPSLSILINHLSHLRVLPSVFFFFFSLYREQFVSLFNFHFFFSFVFFSFFLFSLAHFAFVTDFLFQISHLLLYFGFQFTLSVHSISISPQLVCGQTHWSMRDLTNPISFVWYPHFNLWMVFINFFSSQFQLWSFDHRWVVGWGMMSHHLILCLQLRQYWLHTCLLHTKSNPPQYWMQKSFKNLTSTSSPSSL